MAPNLPESPTEKGIDYVIMPRDEFSQVLEDIYYLIRRRMGEDPDGFNTLVKETEIVKSKIPEVLLKEVKREAFEEAATQIFYSTIL